MGTSTIQTTPQSGESRLSEARLNPDRSAEVRAKLEAYGFMLSLESCDKLGSASNNLAECKSIANAVQQHAKLWNTNWSLDQKLDWKTKDDATRAISQGLKQTGLTLRVSPEIANDGNPWVCALDAFGNPVASFRVAGDTGVITHYWGSEALKTPEGRQQMYGEVLAPIFRDPNYRSTFRQWDKPINLTHAETTNAVKVLRDAFGLTNAIHFDFQDMPGDPDFQFRATIRQRSNRERDSDNTITIKLPKDGSGITVSDNITELR